MTLISRSLVYFLARRLGALYGQMRNNTWARNKFAAKTNLAVSSIEYCQCTFDERDIRIRYGSCSGHDAMIPLELYQRVELKTCDLISAGSKTHAECFLISNLRHACRRKKAVGLELRKSAGTAKPDIAFGIRCIVPVADSRTGTINAEEP
jgi:hypothetical protein